MDLGTSVFSDGQAYLSQINSSEKKAVKIHDYRWVIPHISDDVQNYGCEESETNTSTQIKAELDAVYGDSAPSFATVKRWVAEFKRGRTSLADGERSGRPTTATTTDNIEEIHQMIIDNRRIK
ncbi:uncharacterized protein, partial [Mycetomoellerius zeteki]|uniref:uncharacterized protein n=1 Tax=Mycetomoellerius zeteki TaxID=64791 RepID=UPI00084EBFF5